MGMNRNITLVRGIKVNYSQIEPYDFNELDYPHGVGWYGNGEYNTDHVIVGSIFVSLYDIRGSLSLQCDAFSTKNDDEILKFCANVLSMDCASDDIKNWVVADLS